MGSIDKALPHAGFYPDSQNFHSDAAKIRTLFETSKYFRRNLHTTRHFFFFWGLFIPKDMKGTANGIHYVMQKCNALLHFCHSRIIFC